MADEFQLGSGNWWESARSSSSRFESGSSSPSSTALSAVGSYGWPTQVVDMKTSNSTNNSIDSSSVSGSGSFLSSTRGGGGLGGSVLTDPNLQMMGLGLSSQSMDWNQPLFRSEKGDHSSFRTMLQDQDHLSSNTPSFQQADQWPRSQNKMMYSAGSSEEDSSRGGGGGGGSFSLDQSNLISDHSSTNIQMDSSSAIQYPNNPSTATLLQGLFGSEINEPQHQSMNTSNYSYPSSNYGMNSSISSGDHCHQPLILQQPASNSWAKPQNQLHFANNAPFWNASTAAPMNHDVRSNVFPSLQMQLPSSAFDEKPKHKSSSSEPSTKKPRNETPSPLPAFKMRKEKMGDRITALQQLISPFGKTDTASVLSEAIEYIKFLHAQIGVLSNPYLKNGAPIQQQPANYETSKDPEGTKQDLRSRGLCLVPVSSTIPVTHETTVEFWNPTFGGTFR